MTESKAHKDIKSKIMEIGKFEGYRVEKEYTLVDEFFVDVVWFKRPGRYPKYAFEIVVSSSITNSLSSLKTASDEWNCKKLILVASGEKLKKARHLLETTYSEIAPNCNIIGSRNITKLRELITDYNRIKNSIGYQTFPS